jgi:hypothetical protein
MVVISVAVSVFTGTHANPSPLVEDLTVTSVTFSGGNTIHVIVNNSGTLDFAVSEVWVNDEKQAFTTNPSVGRIPPNGCMELSVAYVYVNETSYHIKIVSDRTNEYFASATALVAGALPLRFSRLFVVVSKLGAANVIERFNSGKPKK